MDWQKLAQDAEMCRAVLKATESRFTVGFDVDDEGQRRAVVGLYRRYLAAPYRDMAPEAMAEALWHDSVMAGFGSGLPPACHPC